MKCLVTGGTGFIGSHIVDRLIELGHEVAVVDNLRSGKKENLNPKAKFYEVDVTNKETLEATFVEWKPETVFHLAAQNEVPFSMDHPFEDQQMNIGGMMNLCQVAANSGTKKIIYSNTGGALYGEVPMEDMPIKEDHPILKPTSFYGVSKGSAETYLKLYGYLNNLQWISLRYANVYGPRQAGNKEAGIVAIFVTKMLQNKRSFSASEVPTINGEGQHTRDYVYVGDVVEANIKALGHQENDYFNISTGTQTSNLEVFNTIGSVLKIDFRPNFGPNRPGDPLKNALDPSKAKQKLGWQAQVTFKEGVEKTIKFYQELS